MKYFTRGVRLGALLLVGVAAGCGGGEDDARPSNVLLVTLDTLRADHLGAYGSKTVRTPRMDRLASEGTLFENAAAPMPLTRPSHFSILTSRYPREHGVLNNAMSLPDSALTLTELLRDEGLRTAAFVGVKLLSRDSGGGQGFDEYDAPSSVQLRSAEAVVTRALAWTAELSANERFFLWVHLFDPHLPYAPPPEHQRDLDERLQKTLPSIDWKHLYTIAQANEGDVPERIFEHAKALYRGDVEYTDHWVGELLDGLADQGRMQSTLTVLTADHGESFELGTFFEHADCLYDGAIRIPMIVHAPGFVPAATRIVTQASGIDVAPTVIGALGLEVPAVFSGRSLLELANDEDRYVLIQHPFYQPGAAANRATKQAMIQSVAGMPTSKILVDVEKVGLVGPDWKYLRAADASELYRLGPLADEVNNLVDSEIDVCSDLDAVLGEALARHPLQVIDTTEINADLLETLRALGYIGGETE